MAITKERKRLNKLRTDRTSDYVCVDCGIQFLSKKQLEAGGNVTTFHMGECGICKDTKGVTSIRHYNYLNKPKDEQSTNQK